MKFLIRYIVSATAHAFLILFGWLPRYRAACYEAAYALGWRSRPQRISDLPITHIPLIDAKALLPNPPPVLVLEQDEANGNVTSFELLLISQWVAHQQARECFEIGTFDGRTTLNVAANLPADGHVYTLDLPATDIDRTTHTIAPGDQSFIRKEQSGARFVGTAWESRITQLYGDSATFDYSPYEGKMDLVFVDGSHSYDYVKADTATALRLLKPGGTIFWHDYGSKWWKDLTRALNELYAEDPRLSQMRHIKGTALVVLVVGGRSG